MAKLINLAILATLMKQRTYTTNLAILLRHLAILLGQLAILLGHLKGGLVKEGCDSRRSNRGSQNGVGYGRCFPAWTYVVNPYQVGARQDGRGEGGQRGVHSAIGRNILT